MSDTPYLYGKLNKQIEYLRYKFESSDGTIFIDKLDDYSIDLTTNIQSQLKIKQVARDADPSNDLVKYYALFAYNKKTNKYDIQLGDVIPVGGSGGSIHTTDVYVKVGEQVKMIPVLDENGNQVYDDQGNILLEAARDEQGNLIYVPLYEKVAVDEESGQLIIKQIPASAIIDHEIKLDQDGNEIKEYIESTLDGNAGGEVY